MNTSTSTTCPASLPQDILHQIFTRLPVKSIVRFKCVSKFFNSLISDPFFIDEHHRNQSLTYPGTSILLCIPSKTCQQIFYTANITEENQGKLQANRVQYLDRQCFHNLVHLTSANGLICLSNHDGDIAICNLSTRQHISLPRTRPVGTSITQNFARAVLGFDSISKKYKVFLSELCCTHGRGSNSSKQHWVLTLGVDKSWREIISFVVPNYPEACLHIDGVIYLINWIIKKEIIAFNVGAEGFRTIPLPCKFRHCTTSSLISPWIELDGRLAAVTINRQWSSIEIWALERSMEWEKHMIPTPLEDSQIIRKASSMDFTTKCNGEIVLLIQVENSFLIFITAFGTQVWRKFEISGIHDCLICLDRLKNGMHIIEENVFFPDRISFNV